MRGSLPCFVPLLALVVAACGGDEVCGPHESAEASVDSITEANERVRWQNLRSSPNNDCGETGGPVSLTLEADQADQVDRNLVLCLPRPDKLSGETIEAADSSRLRVIDVFATLEGDCLASLDRGRALEGTASFHGVCDDGLDPAGYSMDLALVLPVDVNCSGTMSKTTLSFTGSVQVSTN